ncbi:MAG: 4-alpha-glucanotransferase [Desulfobulbus sp.]|jgi:4-alpha-glucanotransferase
MTTSINILQKRSSGVLLPVFSLPAPCGIGDLGPGAYTFIDFLAKAGQSCWQILPLGPTSGDLGHSPYMSASALAGNPLLISPELLVEGGLLQAHQLAYPDFSAYNIDYHRVEAHKKYLLELAWEAFQGPANVGRLDDFIAAHPWAQDYGLFLALKDWYDQAAWFEWPKPIRKRDAKALLAAQKDLHSAIRKHCFKQYLFFEQWQRLRLYAQEKGVQLIGDLPIYVAMDSVDVWMNQEIFALDPDSCEATHIAGVPPDYFSETGQRWGNPLYRWNSDTAAVRAQLYDWWEQRLRQNFFLVDVLRLDHFRGFESYWSVPAEEETAMVGEWLPGPGLPFFTEMNRRLGQMPLIAEDLGIITPEVEALRQALGLPGMKILLFAFDYFTDNSYLPYNCPPNSVIYTGTHDNETAVGWFLNPAVDPAFKQQAKRFANKNDDNPGSFHTDLIYLAMSASSNLAIFPMQDLLGFGNDCRMNTPGQSKGNWLWRVAPHYINDDLAAWLRELTRFFGRLPAQTPQRKQQAHNDAHPYS